MRHLPTQNYCGLTVVLSNPSRFDLDNNYLISGFAGTYFNEILAEHKLHRNNCDIREHSSQSEGLLPETKVVLLLGDPAFKGWTQDKYKAASLGEQRGYPIDIPAGIPAICSYSPQDCFDMQKYEDRLNPLLNDDSEDEAAKEDEDEDDNSIKRHGKTRRSNYRFWFKRDLSKAIWRLGNNSFDNTPWETRVYPTSQEVIGVLASTKDQDLYLDIETDLEDQNLFCLGFNFSNSNLVYVVPFLRYDYTLAYSDYHRIMRSLSVALRSNTVVVHNSMFDLCVLSYKYGLPIPSRNYDTMLSQHRCFPEAEKSLGHSISSWPRLWSMPFHKDEGVFPPRSLQQEKELWQYNAKDVWAMRLIKQEQLAYAATDEGLWASVQQANSLIEPYLICQLTGMRYDTEKAAAIRKKNDRLMTHYLRAIKVLAGREVLPTSPKQCRDYFFRDLGYKPTMYTKDKTTGQAKNPSTGEDALQKLKLKYPLNAAIDFMIAYRERAKESGMVKFNPMPLN